MLLGKCVKVYESVHLEQAMEAVKYFVEKTLPDREAAGVPHQLGSRSAVWLDVTKSDDTVDHLMIYETKTMYVVRRYYLSSNMEGVNEAE
jgi:hypothetical protein